MCSKELWIPILAIILAITAGCSGPGSGIFSKRTPHEAYENKLKDAELLTSALGEAWKSAASAALHQPLTISLPYQEKGFFAAEIPSAAGLVFNVRRGQKIDIRVQATPTPDFNLFLDLFDFTAGNEPAHLQSAETDSLHLQQEIGKDGQFLLRIQPELLKSGSYTLVIQNNATLAFPVPSVSTSAIGSFWGNSRDGGARSHEGIDIFANRGADVSAAADGFVTSVSENNLGGKVVFMRPHRKNYSLYYAHLDSQLVRVGQEVKTGQVLGLVGNTGNARTTAPHLHFGIYTSSGAIDPLPFVKQVSDKPEAIRSSVAALNEFGYTTRQTTVYNSPTPKADSSFKINDETPLRIIAATGNWYKVQLPGGKAAFISYNHVKTGAAIKKMAIDSNTIAYTAADGNAVAKTQFSKGNSIEILGQYNGYYFVRNETVSGWIKIPNTK